MFRNVARLAPRRGLHTARTQAASLATRHRLALGVGASVTVAGYMAWQFAMDAHKVAADASPSWTPTEGTNTSEKHASTQESEGPSEPKTEGDSEEQDSSQQAAYDPVTGKINWDCPCLGGMAYGPCGVQFREAFSCFIYSEDEPKGINCVEKFKAMQSCFREHPEVYGEEMLAEDDDDDELTVNTPSDSPTPAPVPVAASTSSSDGPSQHSH